ncbi:preprotein translocase subunit SecA [Spiroplasma sp. NBRC 100390]|uniref:preprotein translocase subunit SecA n=1 Tax=unclassified Spiroplasma TaxID=2637901 RepID=UPI000892994F|nr:MULTISPECIES: preprotein translocase subunit SecA [unclassified Spiroplasma]AOX43472.1 preprotein translocase subunit SecA [Spiroplasma sp. TU-14]APE12942.1 preprotein translocase subunit SecA [Spiroplasma sp. NBRC 100390]
MAVSDRNIVKKHGKIADKIIALDGTMQALSDEALKAKTAEFKERLAQGATLDDILIEAFAVAREAARRILGLHAYRVQLIGGIVLHEGDVAEMKTGEGKTLTALMPTYLNGLTGKGVHIVTVNEYLSKRDSEINGQVFSFLGLTVGLNTRSGNKDEKRAAYSCDITYTTNAELGFDYLRDNMAKNFSDKVQHGLNYAIIDEADSILIDESRTPLIISGGRQNRIPQYQAADHFAKSLSRENDLEIDLETKQVYLTPEGILKAEKIFSINSLFDIKNTELYHLILNALKANFVFKNGIEYVVQNNEIILIDQFTGRLMPGRAYSDGLQQSLQAKEHVEIEQETVTMATITYQNFFRLYNKLSGMTGTAKTEEEEFVKIYNMRVIQIPTNRPLIRRDEADYMFANRDAKMQAMMKEILTLHEKGQPILIGTTSVESSEIVSHYLRNANLKFEMLNAKNHEREADIIAQAGEKKAITLATNMAGRGTDIKLGEGVTNLGGLAVFGVERNEARRIDNQLRGRSGRQGDPGFSRFYVAMDDELMMRFGGDRLRRIFARLGSDFIQSRMLTRAISNAQKKVEGMNFDQRKHILDYDNVLAQHREAMYARRDQILTASDLKPIIKKMQYSAAYDLTKMFGNESHGEWFIRYDELIKGVNDKVVANNALDKTVMEKMTREEVAKYLAEKMNVFYQARTEDVPADVMNQIERNAIISSFDEYWTKHIDQASKLRSGIYLRSYAQTNPLHAYVEEAAKLFEHMQLSIAHEVVIKLANVVIRKVEDGSVEPMQDSEQEVREFKQKG